MQCIHAHITISPRTLQIYETGQQSMADYEASAATDPTTATLRGTNATNASASQPVRGTGAAAQDPAGGSQPAADCITGCEAYNGVLACLTADSQIRLCTGSGGSAGNSSADPAGGAQLAASPANASALPTEADYLPAADCTSACAQEGGLFYCLTASGDVRQCEYLPSSASTASSDPAALSPSPPPSTATAGGAQEAAAVQLGGQPLCFLNGQSVPGIAAVESCAAGYMCAALSREQVRSLHDVCRMHVLHMDARLTANFQQISVAATHLPSLIFQRCRLSPAWGRRSRGWECAPLLPRCVSQGRRQLLARWQLLAPCLTCLP